MPRRKIPFSRAKIASLQFPCPEIRRISAETGGAHEGRAQCAKQAVVSPMSKGALQAAALQGDYCELWNRSPFAFQSSPAACTAGTGRFLRRKILFSKAKIASLQFPRPEIRRILAETD